MAMARPPNVVVSQNLTQQTTSSTVSKATINLPDEVKNHVVIGISLMNILVPELKKYINFKVKDFYGKLVRDYKINTPNNTLQNPKDSGFKFQYRDSNKLYQ